METNYETIKIAHYYYNLSYNQQEIADRLHTSRQRVNRILKRAVAEGIVQIYVQGYKDSYIEMESELETRLGLYEARLVERGNSAYFGQTVLRYLEDFLQDGMHVGLTYGSTLAGICPVGVARVQREINVVPMLGGINTNRADISPGEIARLFAEYFGGEAYNLLAPAILDDHKLKEPINREAQNQPLLEMYKKINISLMSIGAIAEAEKFVRANVLQQEDYDMLKQKGAVGDVGFRFFNDQGEIVSASFNDRLTGIETEDFKNIELRAGVAYGKQKAQAITAAIRGGHVNVLFTDIPTAEALLATSDS